MKKKFKKRKLVSKDWDSNGNVYGWEREGVSKWQKVADQV